MSRPRRYALIPALLAAMPLHAADILPNALETCARIVSSSGRLACFDRVASGASELGAYQQYLGDKSDITIALREVLEPELRKDAALADIYRRIEMPLSPVLMRMEERGIRVHVPFLEEMSATMGKQIADLEKQIYAEAGTEFNINSPAQLGHILPLTMMLLGGFLTAVTAWVVIVEMRARVRMVDAIGRTGEHEAPGAPGITAFTGLLRPFVQIPAQVALLGVAFSLFVGATILAV